MRTSLLVLMIAGCVGEANLGAAPRLVRLDAGSTRLDSGALVDVSVDRTHDIDDDSIDNPPTVAIDVEPSEDRCDTCYDLSARGEMVSGNFTVEWEDGSGEGSRHVCPTAPSTSYTVTLLDVASGRTAVATRSLAERSSTCVDAGTPAPMFCLNNGTFTIDPARPPTPASALPASPWLACAKMLPNQMLPNRPQIIDSSSTFMGVAVLPATNGTTYLGLGEYEQATAPLCANIEAQETRSFTVDLASGSADADVGLPRLEIWGGLAADCSQSELLWSSAMLTSSFTSSCVTIRPRKFTDSLTLRAVSSEPRFFAGRLLVDHIQPVSACP